MDDEETLTRIREFLRHRLPLELKRAETSLNDFQECHRVMQIDIAVQSKKLVTMKSEEITKARRAWELHRNLLPDNIEIPPGTTP